jgi:hypothetical protein
MEKAESFLRWRTKEKCPLSPPWSNMVLKVLARTIRYKKEIKAAHIGEEEVNLYREQDLI